MAGKNDPGGTRLPIKVDATSNGEYAPIPIGPDAEQANASALESAERNAKRLGLSRRDFLLSSCGAAGTLLAFNDAFARRGPRGGFYDLPAEAALEPAAAKAVTGDEFIFDVQGHFVSPAGIAKRAPSWARALSGMPKAGCAIAADHPHGDTGCFGPMQFINDVFMDSDTDVMALSFVPSAPDAEPLTIEEADAVRQIVGEMEGTNRLLLHGRVNPNQDGDLERMDELARRWEVSAWKTYTQFGPDGRGFFLSDEDTGIPFIEKARSLGVKVICVHKGIPFGRRSYEHSLCDDIGVVAKRFPDVNFLIYHSGFVPGQAEQGFDAESNRDGVDSLVRTVIEHGLGPNSNVYAELGSTWRYVMRDPDSAAHVIGKLVHYLGEDNVLWGTDSIWYGSPQDQIQAFRTFQIAEALRDQYGYPEMTPLRRAKIFGQNALSAYGLKRKDFVGRLRQDRFEHARESQRETADPHFLTFGPKSRRDFLRLLALNGGQPV